jgi:hypothetical protein
MECAREERRCEESYKESNGMALLSTRRATDPFDRHRCAGADAGRAKRDGFGDTDSPTIGLVPLRDQGASRKSRYLFGSNKRRKSFPTRRNGAAMRYVAR